MYPVCVSSSRREMRWDHARAMVHEKTMVHEAMVHEKRWSNAKDAIVHSNHPSEVAIQRFHSIRSTQPAGNARWFSYSVIGSPPIIHPPRLNTVLGETSDLETISTPLRANTRNHIARFRSNLISPGSSALRIPSARQGRKLECSCRLHSRRWRAIIKCKSRCGKNRYGLGKSRRLCRADLQRYRRHTLSPLDAWPCS